MTWWACKRNVFDGKKNNNKFANLAEQLFHKNVHYFTSWPILVN